MLPPAVTLMMDAIWSVGLPSLSAISHVPARFFIFSRAAFVGGAGSCGPDLSPPWLAAERLSIRIVNISPARNRRFIVVPPTTENVINTTTKKKQKTKKKNMNGQNQHKNIKRRLSVVDSTPRS